MPALRALAAVGFLVGTGLAVAGIFLDDQAVTLSGFVTWIVGAALGLWAHRLSS